jgi:hypothetical protein
MDAAWESAWSSVAALSIGGISAILGLWVGRDTRRPAYFAAAMSLLVAVAVGVGIAQSVLDAEDAIQKEADLDRMVESVTEIAMATGDESLAKLIEDQLGMKVELPEPEPEPVPVEGEGAEGEGAEGAPSADPAADADPAAEPAAPADEAVPSPPAPE